jgi:hypothetical protein
VAVVSAVIESVNAGLAVAGASVGDDAGEPDAGGVTWSGNSMARSSADSSRTFPVLSRERHRASAADEVAERRERSDFPAAVPPVLPPALGPPCPAPPSVALP